MKKLSEEKEQKKKSSMYSHCPECNELITNALGICYNCQNSDYDPYPDELGFGDEYEFEDDYDDYDDCDDYGDDDYDY